MSRLMRDGTAEIVSRDQIFRRERGQRNVVFPCSFDHEQDGNLTRFSLTLALCMYVCMVITYSRVWINRVRLPILLVVS